MFPKTRTEETDWEGLGVLQRMSVLPAVQRVKNLQSFNHHCIQFLEDRWGNTVVDMLLSRLWNIFTGIKKKKTLCLLLLVCNFSFSHRVYVQGVDGQIVRVLTETVEHLFEGHLLPVLLQHHTFCLTLVVVLDEVQQVFLRHASCGVDVCVHLRRRRRTGESPERYGAWVRTQALCVKTNLPDVVEISVRNTFQLLQFSHLIQHLVEVELWA